ncbi:M10 family metallopeptidase C-terminal domain-containing protein [Pseudophaeobacter arcticus]|jgi:serralysin|uniref:M10 family metallopeptidase C-terminal domain-containing protein n=1 Tax=Pseudophaeobacter arcticus TaxID=385492 RepID=UPI0039E23A88
MCEFCGNRDHRLFVEDTTHTPTVETSYAAKPTNTVDEIADYLTTGYWEANGSTPRSFAETTGDQLTVNLSGLTTSAKAVARQALEAWEAVSGLEFVETTSSIVDISFDDEDQRGAYAQSYVFSSGEIYRSWVNIPTWWDANPEYYVQTYIHEIGHALGLGHAGLYNGTGTYEDDAEYANDSWQMSIMSYFSQDEATGVDADFAYVYTPQIADIAAIQDLYGVPTNVETGDTTYGDGNTTGRSIMDMDHGYAFTIVDSGGIDTINLASRSYNQNLSLVVDTFSDLNGKIGNFAIGRGTVIEKAFTGSGHDTITGNDANNVFDTSSGNDQIFAGAGVDIIYAGAGDDTIYGGADADLISGGEGDDSMVGGTGDDLYYVDSANDQVIELAGEGNDTILSSISIALYDSSAYVENLTLTGTDDLNGTGNGLNNVITGNDGNNILNGAWGNDSLTGGAGNDTFQDDQGVDTMVGGTGNDTYHLDDAGDRIVENFGEGADHAIFSFDDKIKLWEYSKNVESLALTGDADWATGNGLNNTIYGNTTKNNILNGAWGNDTLYGGAGNDTLRDDHGTDLMVGGAGNDIYFLDDAADRVVESFGEGWDYIVASFADNLKLWEYSKNVEVVILKGDADWVAGNGLNNLIKGNATKASVLNGAWGNDTLYGGTGDDTLRDDHGNDHFTGGAGADSFIFAGSFGTDLIHDFTTSEVGEIIDLAGVSEITDYSDLVQNHLSEVNGNAVISDNLGNSITLAGVGLGDLTADDFLF